MKLRVVLVTGDSDYTERLKARLSARYFSRVQLSSFSDAAAAEEKARELRPDVMLIDEDLYREDIEIPRRCAVAILIRDKGIRSIGGVDAICRYESCADLVGDLTEVYARKADADGVRFDEAGGHDKRIVTFFPAAGGVGASTLAASFARYLAGEGESVLYLNLEELGMADTYFSGSDRGSFSKVLYALQMDNQSTASKLESALSRDVSGVLFYSGCDSCLDMLDMTPEKIASLFEYLGKLDGFDYIVTDMDFGIGKKAFDQISRSSATIFVSDGSEAANFKLKRISDALEIRLGDDVGGKLLVMYNRFSSKYSVKAQNTIFTEAGGVGRIENAGAKELLEIISRNGAFRGIIA